MVVTGANPPCGTDAAIHQTVSALMARARAAQGIYECYGQEQVDEVVTAAGWSLVHPQHNRQLAELAVAAGQQVEVGEVLAVVRPADELADELAEPDTDPEQDQP